MEGDRRTWTLLGVPAAKAGKRLPAGYPASPAPPTSAAVGGSAAAHPVQREPEEMKEMALQSQTLRASTSNSSPPTEQPLIMQALQKLKERERKKLTILFNNAYLIAKQGHPKIFSNSRFICIIADGSTDNAIIEQETVLVRVVSDGKPYTLFADLVPLEHAHARGVLDGIAKGIQRLSLDLVGMRSTEYPGPSLIAVNFDGAAVMMGSKGGVAALLKKDIPFLLPFHCVAHKLQLGILDAVKSKPSICQFEETLKWIFKFYWYSPKRRRDAKEISRIIDENFAHFTDIKQIRWVSSKTRALAAMQQNLQTVVLHLGQVAAGSDDSAAKAKKYLSIVTSFTFIKNLYSLRDVLKPVSKLSEFFQSNELLLMHVPPAVEKCALTLVGLKSELGEYMQQFKKLYHPEEKKFGNISTDGWEIKLSGCCPPAATIQSDSEFIDSVVKYIDERFENFNSMPVQGFQAFDYTLWPESREELYKYGISDIEAIVQHFEVLFTTDERLAIVEEFCGLKTHMKSFQSKGIPVLPAYSTLLATKPPTLTNILKLVEMMFTFSVSTAEAERVFSAMNVIKNPLRTRLNQDILQDLMLLKIEGPNFEEYDPSRAIDLWLTTGGTKHVPCCRPYSWHPPESREVEEQTPDLDQQVEEVVKSCVVRQASGQPDPPAPVITEDGPTVPWQLASVEFGSLPDGSYMLIVMDNYSRYTEVEIVMTTAVTEVILKMEKIMATQRLFGEIRSDNGPLFNSHEGAESYKPRTSSNDASRPSGPKPMGKWSVLFEHSQRLFE
ncbi:hypothetical protein NDU88_004186 [Pleurodeles waltl]|uniref:Integrase catalytic domain-containing protein n=1 Tax=Pleurodeles waltl TaxID=8319 RepID=A0AAV7V2A6_PLEWA|nr:hypothetical protein NDU88_004186 [Pleurodeles waltl]